jgi:hypothetical protein
MAVKGIGASFKLDSSVAVLTDVSTYLDGINATSTPDELDGTTFQPNVASPTKNIIAGLRTRGYSLTGKYTAASLSFFAAIEGLNDLHYEYGPEGTTAGKPKISGLCNCLSASAPAASVTGVITFTVELRATTQVLGTY